MRTTWNDHRMGYSSNKGEWRIQVEMSLWVPWDLNEFYEYVPYISAGGAQSVITFGATKGVK